MISLAIVLKRLKKTSLLLFIFPSVAIIFSLIIHNLLVSFKYQPQLFYKNFSSNLKVIFCDEKNNFCSDVSYIHDVGNLDLFDCIKNETIFYFHYDDNKYLEKDFLQIFNDTNYNKKKFTKITFNQIDKENITCIKNSKFFNFYNNFKSISNYIHKIKNHEKFTYGTSEVVNPFFYGETSISNIVKRLPLAYFFKPLIYISALLMMLYWYLNNLTAKNIQNTSKNLYFFYFGILSAIFLIFHVTFLGLNIENKLFHKIRRIIIVLFILFEIISQLLLVINLRKNLEKYKPYISRKVLSLKYYLISFMIIVTMLILFILTFFDLSSRFDYFLEWNYFLILLFFYLLSFFLWKINKSKTY